jgi:hypothetical protein
MRDKSPVSDRPLRQEELHLIVGLLTESPQGNKIISDAAEAVVCDMNDGGMGSIRFIRSNSNRRKFGREVYHGAFADSDGVPVSVTINVDQYGDLFELDFFKADFSPLARYPSIEDLKTVQAP